MEIPYEAPNKKIINKKFIGLVTEIKENSKFCCKFLRQSSNSNKNIYVFPDIPDFADIEASQIISELTPTFIKRGRHSFAVHI